MTRIFRFNINSNCNLVSICYIDGTEDMQKLQTVLLANKVNLRKYVDKSIET